MHPPARPQQSRVGELLAVDVPLLVAQGERDPFCGPDDVRAAIDEKPAAQVVAVPGDHSLRRHLAAVTTAVGWLDGVRPA